MGGFLSTHTLTPEDRGLYSHRAVKLRFHEAKGLDTTFAQIHFTVDYRRPGTQTFFTCPEFI